MVRRIQIETKLQKANDEIANQNRIVFKQHNVFVINMMGSPGCGKTMLLEQTVKLLSRYKMGVIEGDIATSRDADRLRNHRIPVALINTGGACHLEARMISKALAQLRLNELDILFIENVGNLVCPASYDLGENKRVVLISTPEGTDKVAKYPKMLREADLVLLNKIDMLDFSGFNLKIFKQDLLDLRGSSEFISISAKTKEGLANWIKWLNTSIK